MIAGRLSLFPLLLMLLVMGLASCKVDSINPIASLDSTQPDAALYGVWRYKAKGELTYVHIGPEFSPGTGDAAAASKRTRLVIIDHKPNGITDEAYVAYVSRIGKNRYLNVVQVEGNKTVGFIFVAYVLIDRDTVRFSTMNEELLKAAISSGQIKGAVRGEGLSAETVITAESADIERFLGRHGGALFTNPVVLTRVQTR